MREHGGYTIATRKLEQRYEAEELSTPNAVAHQHPGAGAHHHQSCREV